MKTACPKTSRRGDAYETRCREFFHRAMNSRKRTLPRMLRILANFGTPEEHTRILRAASEIEDARREFAFHFSNPKP